jgi:pantoate--beta-alanine ligase
VSVTLTPEALAPRPLTAVDPSPVRVLATVAEYAATLDALRAAGRTVGLVPTMGALHAGHRSLIRRAAEECDVVAVSIFVNPTQFGDAADLANYPRTLESDLDVVASAGGSLVFAPSVTEMYPEPPGSSPAAVTVPAFSGLWEGASRPGHFDGVATVVVKLLSATGRCRAYFGEKDFQQLAMVTTVARQLLLPAEVVGCQTVRDTDGLALSSRNVRLSSDERRAALALGRALRAGASLIHRGEESPAVVEAQMARVVAEERSVTLDYAVVVHADELERAWTCATARPLRLLIAAQVGPVRLIDNLDPLLGC